eukprot:5190373-Pleurochrysis_carterae.AAC.1
MSSAENEAQAATSERARPSFSRPNNRSLCRDRSAKLANSCSSVGSIQYIASYPARAGLLLVVLI